MWSLFRGTILWFCQWRMYWSACLRLPIGQLNSGWINRAKCASYSATLSLIIVHLFATHPHSLVLIITSVLYSSVSLVRFSKIFFWSQNPCLVFPKEFGPEDVGVFRPMFFMRIAANAGISSSPSLSSSSAQNADETFNFVTSGFRAATALLLPLPSLILMPVLLRGWVILTGSGLQDLLAGSCAVSENSFDEILCKILDNQSTYSVHGTVAEGILNVTCLWVRPQMKELPKNKNWNDLALLPTDSRFCNESLGE